jgi:hypothetical protein
MTTATYLIIVGIVIAVLCGALAIWGRGSYRNLSSVFLVVGILVLAIGVTVQQVDQYRQQQALAMQTAPAAQPAPMEASGSSMPPAARPVPILPPLGMRGPSGAAAPNPYAGGMR